MNAKQALPELTLNFDRPRKATLNLRAMNALEQWVEENVKDEKGQPVRQLWKGFNWSSMNTRDMTRILWASLLTDADNNGEQLTYEEVEKIASAAALLESVDKFVALIEELFDRAMPALESGELVRTMESLEKKRTAALLAANSVQPTGSSSSPSA